MYDQAFKWLHTTIINEIVHMPIFKEYLLKLRLINGQTRIESSLIMNVSMETIISLGSLNLIV